MFYGTNRQTPFYRTGVFQTAANLGPITAAWLSYLTKTYHVANAGRCDRVNADLALQQAFLRTLDQSAQAQKVALVLVDWKYTPDQTGSAAQAAPAAPAARSAAQTTSTGAPQPHQQVLSYVCSFNYDDRQTPHGTFYRTGVFQTAASPQVLSDAWWSYLTKTYHVSGAAVAHCDRAQPDPAGQQNGLTSMDKQMQALREVIVHVDWRYPTGQTGPTTQAAPAAPAAGSAAPTISAPQGQITTVEQLPEPFRRNALAEVANSKAYCQGNEIISGLLDCDCFSRIVLKYRIAHAQEYHVPRGGQDDGGWLYFSNLVVGPLDCTECISDERVSNWAAAQELKSFLPGWSDADKKFLTACMARTFLASFRAKPSLGMYRNSWGVAGESCRKQLGH